MRVLLVNDDGPPAMVSPHVYGLWESLQTQLGWQVSVVLPSSQKSWGSMQFSLTPIGVWYYYPIKGNYNGSMEGTSGSWSATRRPLRENEVGEWVLLDGSPTTCASVGLNSFDSLVPSSSDNSADAASSPPPFDLVISGPNFGRNTGTAFALGSGTIGAAMAGSLSGMKAISLSYGHFQVLSEEMKQAKEKYRTRSSSVSSGEGKDASSAPRKSEVVEMAHNLSCRIISKLYSNWEPSVSVYSVNVPLSYILKEEQVYWTNMWNSRYGRLFQMNEVDTTAEPAIATLPKSAPRPVQEFLFAPDMAGMLQPKAPKEHTDVWALTRGYVSVSRLEARYAEAQPSQASQGRFKL